MSVWLALAVIAGALLVLSRIALNRRGVLGALLLTQVAYWTIGFVARPMFLVLVNPGSRPNDPLADGRLIYYGYSVALGQVLTPVAVGIVVYVAGLWLLTRRPSRMTTARERRFLAPSSIGILLAAGWVLRAASLQAPEVNVLDTLAAVGSVAVGAAILFTAKLPPPIALAAIAISELTWSVATASKTPILALALWLVIRLISDGTRVPKKAIAGIAVAGLGAFFAIQNVKVSAGRLTSSDEYSFAYPPITRLFLPLLARFDAIQANTDAFAAGPQSWMSPGEAGSNFLYSLVPQFLLSSPKEFAGVLWGTQVRPISLPGKAGANLAEGTFAEGWVIGGWDGVIVESFMLVAVVALVAWLLTRRHLYGMFLGLAVTSQPLIFERGMLGIGEGFGKGLQIALVASLAIWFLQLAEKPAAPTSRSLAHSRD